MFIFVKLTSWYSFVIYFQSYYEHWYIEDHLRSSVSAFLWWWWGWFRTRFLMFGFMSLRPNKCNTMWTRAEWKNELIENIEIYTIASVKEWSQANRRVILCVILIVEYTKEILHASIHTHKRWVIMIMTSKETHQDRSWKHHQIWLRWQGCVWAYSFNVSTR